MSAQKLPASFGRYVLEERIGAGGMAEVFRAHIAQEGFRKPVCIKRILPHIAAAPDMLDMFRDEAALAAVLDHSNIVRVFDFGEVDGTFYLGMELVDGMDLHTLMKRMRREQRRFSVGQVLRVGIDLCRALSYAHGAKGKSGAPLHIVHRDVSPQNVLVSRAGEVKVTDFGIAKATERLSETATGVLKGKANYMSPEQAACEAIDHRTDQFAVGIVLWEMLAGRPLFGEAANTRALLNVMECEVPSLRAEREDVPASLDEALQRALSKEPGARFSDMRALQQELMRLRFSSALDPVESELAPLLAEGGESQSREEEPSAPGRASSPSLVFARPSLESEFDLSAFDTGSQINRTARGGKYGGLVRELLERFPFRGEYGDLVERFPCLRDRPGVRPWNPFLLDADVKGIAPEELESWSPGALDEAARGALLASSFVIHSFFRSSPVVMKKAQALWDLEHKAAYASFFLHWKECPPLQGPWWQSAEPDVARTG